MAEFLSLVFSNKPGSWAYEIRTEIIRKSIHLVLAIVPVLAHWNRAFTILLLFIGTIIYSYSEYMRFRGFEIPVLGKITRLAARKRDAGKFVKGPVTLGLGAIIALLLFPEPAASIAIYALAFGDGLSSLVGKSFGTLRIPFSGGKSLEGSLSCFIATMCCAWALTNNAPHAALVALVATAIELVPAKDIDNLLIPVVTGFAAMLIF